MVSASIQMAWAKSLVGRDWEIFWNDEEENADQKEEASAERAETETEPDKNSNEDDNKDPGGDNGSVGSIIDDWYAGYILSLNSDSTDDGNVTFKVRFVGDEEIYDMALEPSKVRPSARGWIKRTKSLLCGGGLDDKEEGLPPDTSMIDDQESLNNFRTEMDSYCYVSSNANLPEQKEGLQPPRSDDVKKILNLRYLLRAQILLRSRLATVVNHHGSTKYVDGQPNPTESYLDHLFRCCQDMDLVCGWYLRCWELLVKLFGETSTVNQSTPSIEIDLTVDKVFHEFLEYGKISLVNCATMDVTPTASKRRLLSSETSPSRRPKRRRKISRWGNGNAPDSIDIVADECDLRSTSSVDQFVATVRHNTERSFLSIFANMLQTLSHFVVDPALKWQRQSRLFIGETSVSNDLAMEDGVDVSSTTSPVGNEEKEEEGSSDEEAEEIFFTLEEIESCYGTTQTNPVLAELDLGECEEKLRRKISDIKMAAENATTLLKSLANSTEVKSKDEDKVLVGLNSILESARLAGHSLFNVEPIGKSDSRITRTLLMNALDFRSWLLDVWHAQRVRERYTFIEKLTSRSGRLPDLGTAESLLSYSQLKTATEEARLETQKMATNLAKHSDLIDKYGRELDLGLESEILMSSEGATKALNEFSLSVPCVSLVEEKIGVRADLLDWSTRAMAVVEGCQGWTKYDKLEIINRDLQTIVSGNSQRRKQLVHGSEMDPEIDREISSFASADSIMVCGGVMDNVTGVYSKALDWKERADAIISALRAHGNSAAGDTTNPSKLPAMVDIKRINDLLEDYDAIKVDQAGIKQTLGQVCDQANSWSYNLLSTIINDKFPLGNCLSFLESQRACRPKGLIMDPTRTVFDSVLDLLVWHSRVNKAVATRPSTGNNANHEALGADAMSSFLMEVMYPLLGEGIETLEIFTGVATAEGFCSQVDFEAEKTIHLLERLHVRRSAKAISRDRLESHEIGSALLSRIASPSEDIAHGLPLFTLLWVQWHVFVTQLVHACGETSMMDDDVVTDRDSSSVCTSLTEAKALLARKPTLRTGTSVPDNITFLESSKSTELARLDELVREAEGKECEIRDLLQRSKDMLKGSIQKADTVREHLRQLKESLVNLKDRSSGKCGLSLDTAMEPQVDHHIKIFTWLVRTFAYPLLHLDEASFSCWSQNHNDDDRQRIPFDVLISLFDRMPCEVQNQAGDFALISLRVRELYVAAKKWQDEITRNTSISFRGGKRRAVGSPSPSEPDQEASSKIQIEQMKKLAQNPILSKVVMPRESAVNGILESSSQFEVELQKFLGNDYGGYCPDRAPYPAKNSLVGENGEFILYRLTGSPLFGVLQASLSTLSNVGSNVLAETPGKATFDWIKAAVAWIEHLAEVITSDSPFESVNGNILVIPGSDARETLTDGESIFLTIPEDLKRTLSKHGIFVTTNRQEKSIRVTLKKDGAHHSVGGTVIRWCPILFECLKSDVARLDDWERALTEILSDFNAFFSETRDQPKRNEKNLYQWFCYREQVRNLLQEGQESLVISPQKGLVSSFQNLLTSINNYLNKHCRPDLEKKFAKRWFAQSSSLVDDRFLLLDSLLYRAAAAEGHQFPIPNDLQPETNFRDACRSCVENGLKKAAKAVGLDYSDPKEISDHDMNSHCRMIAWDVEREMFERYQGELGSGRVSEEYRKKARSLRISLEDKNCLSLRLRVLTGDVNASTLVSMSSEDFAISKAKNPYMRPKKEAKVLSKTVVKDQEGRADNGEAPAANAGKDAAMASNGRSGKKPASNGLKSALRVSKHAVKSSVVNGPQGGATTVAATADDIETSKRKAASIAPSSKAAAATAVESITDESSPSVLKALMKASKKARPPPPPSLATSFQINSSPPSRRLESTGGSDSFRIEIGNPRSAFHSALYLDDDSMIGVNGFLSETLGERGRLRSEEFSRFLRDKLSGGRWQAIPLRLVTISDEDAREYKKFYKEYEMRNRIAMFYVGQNSKLFLVTPKYHDAARMAGLDPFSNRASTYAVVLTKEIMFP